MPATKLLSLLLFPIISLFLAGCSSLSIPGRNQGALQVTSGETVNYAVYLDENHLGQTPFFDERIKTGNYTLDLRDINTNKSVWQSKISISKRTLSVVNFTPATNPDESSSEILYLEPLANKDNVRLTISTLPDNVVIRIDNEVRGFTPKLFEDLSPGDHQITLEAPGYLSKTINAKTTAGHHLIIQAELGRDTSLKIEEEVIPDTAPIPGASQSATPSASPSVTSTTNSEETPAELEEESDRDKVVDGNTQGYDEPSQYTGDKQIVEILSATVGLDWLRVRETPNGLANNEVARVQVGDYYPYVGLSDNEEWAEIEYVTGKTGWVSSAYAEIVDEE